MTTQGASATRDYDDVRIAELCLELERPKEALRILRPLIDAGRRTPETMLLMAQACYETRATREALEWARRAVGIEGDDAWGWRLVAASASRNGDHEVALAASLRAIELDPQNWRTHAERVEVDMECRRVTEDTWDAAQAAVELAPNEVGPLLTSARLAHYKGYLEGARTFYAAILRLDPGNAYAKRNMVRAQLDANDMAGATSAFADMLARDPGSRSLTRSIRRAVLRTLEWVSGILLIGLILIGMLAILGYVDHGSPVVNALLAGVLVLMLAGLVFAFVRYRRRLGAGGDDFLRSLPTLCPALVVLAAIQALVLVSGIVVVVLLIASIAAASTVLAVSAVTALFGVFVCIVFARVYAAAL